MLQRRNFGKAARYMVSPRANMGKPPLLAFVLQLEEARAEWHRLPPTSRPGNYPLVLQKTIALCVPPPKLTRWGHSRYSIQEPRTTKMKRTFGVVALLLLMSSPAWSSNITGVTQTWTYDPVAKSGTLHLVNQSGKDVIAYSIGQRVKMPDGSLQLCWRDDEAKRPFCAWH